MVSIGEEPPASSEHDSPRGGATPEFDPTSERPELAVRELAEMFVLEAVEELDRCAIGLVMQQPQMARSDGLERVLSGTQSRRGFGCDR